MYLNCRQFGAGWVHFWRSCRTEDGLLKLWLVPLLLLWVFNSAMAAPFHLRLSAFEAGAAGVPPGWKPWAAQPEIAPRTFVDPARHRTSLGALAIEGHGEAGTYGGWEYTARGVEAGKWYRFTAYDQTRGVEHESLRVVARLDWIGTGEKRAGQPEYAWSVQPEGSWKKLSLEAPAPPKAEAVKLQLCKVATQIAEPIPGPTSARLAAVAKQRHTYLVAGIYERDGRRIYNSSVLIGRSGNLVGKYRKVYLPREEVEAGLTPGGDYPVFHTDFGAVGMMICWDEFYTDPARALARRGAEVILWPVWGGNLTLAKMVSAGYDYATQIIDPNGEVLGQASAQGTAVVPTIDLNKRYVNSWLGNMRGRFMKEVRSDVRELQ